MRIMRIIKLIALLIALIVFPIEASAKRCLRCGGSGHIEIGAKISHFGLEKSTNKIKCPICNEYVYSGHIEKCPDCDGSGQNGRSNKAEQKRNAKSAELDSYLTPQEYGNLQALLESMKDQPYYPDCKTCGGSGNCTHCGGVVNFDEGSCIVCGGSGMCITCSGKGTGSVQYRAPENKAQIEAKIKEIYDIARQRMNNDVSGSSSSSYSSKDNEAYDQSAYSENADEEEEESDKESNWALFIVIGFAAIILYIICKIAG